jgi:diguanylate cyclase (GGDEF)-like protein/PAS domain S-box-containing protein
MLPIVMSIMFPVLAACLAWFRPALPAGIAVDAAVVVLVAMGAVSVLVLARRLQAAGAERDAALARHAADGGRLRVIEAVGPGPMATLDRDLVHEWANQAWLQWTGADADALSTTSLETVLGPGGAPVVAAARRALSGRVHAGRFDVGGRIADIRFEPRFGADGPVDGVHLLAQDASWRASLAQGLDALVDALPEPALVLEAAGGRVARANAAAAARFGDAREALPGRPLSALFEPHTVAAVLQALEAVRADRCPRALAREAGHLARDGGGAGFPIALRLAPLPAESNLQVLLTIQDLGPVLAAEALRAQSAAHAETALGALPSAVLVCDLQERILLLNPAAERLAGWHRDDAVGRALGDVLTFVETGSGAPASSRLQQALRGGKPVAAAERWLLGRDGTRRVVAESAAPLHDRHGQVSGAVLMLQDVTESQAQAQTLAHQAQHDALTGLPNRVLLQDRLSQALAQVERGYRGALLYLDLDRFKPINDSLGHPVGDRVLQEVSARLRRCVRQDDTVSRQGGDEFVLLLVRLADPRDAARVADKLIQAIEQPIHVDGHELRVSASIGIALFPQDGSDTRELARQADAALYHAKRGGRGRYSYVTDVIGASAEERMRTEHDLRIALANGDFVLAWQPQVRLPGGVVDGIEALVRWRDGDGGMVPAEDFIPVAEETGLVADIDEWVLRAACTQAMRWRGEGRPAVPVSTNVSLARFDPDRLLAHVRAVLAETGLPPGQLEIEFQGVQLFAHGSRGQSLVAALKAEGVRVAADDFGSGQASLHALANFEFDALKIDREHVHGMASEPRARRTIEAILAIGRVMGYQVVAKGVEAQAQLDALLALGCDHAQGRLFGEATASPPFALPAATAGARPPDEAVLRGGSG